MGESWGMKGYIEIERTTNGTTAGVCGINTLASFPIA